MELSAIKMNDCGEVGTPVGCGPVEEVVKVRIVGVVGVRTFLLVHDVTLKNFHKTSKGSFINYVTDVRLIIFLFGFCSI